MEIQSANKPVRRTNPLAIASFGLGILAIFPPVFLALGILVPQLISVHLATAYDGYPKTIFDQYLCFGSFPFGFGSLVTGAIAFAGIHKPRGGKGKILAILAIIFGFLGLIYAGLFFIHIMDEPMIYLGFPAIIRTGFL
jgi:hypothetical protein